MTKGVFMRRQRGEASSGGISILGLLGVVFVTLKLLAIEPVASWSWWWVTAPFWGGLALLGVIALIVLLFYAVVKARG